ncbi:RNA polymerase II transcriptional coactivator KELP-like protein [Drosera capensis]
MSDKRRVTVQDFRGKTLVSIREYYKKDGKTLPTAKGISLTVDQWLSFKKNVPAIEKAIAKLGG